MENIKVIAIGQDSPSESDYRELLKKSEQRE